MFLSLITLPEGFATDIMANASALFSDLSSYTTLIIGVVLAAVVIEVVIGAIKR